MVYNAIIRNPNTSKSVINAVTAWINVNLNIFEKNNKLN